ncbi:hypothetical protein [Sedimentibacter sp. MB31-C6]|uniref:hypothetical protein n=1 Tax=Sedimentibacter sp. MB31-C6 TaxID=3109366 RepID=UPI002DDC9B44|nr:hypothetical protein [Sedimentibacter sp. MB36-C1]WSI03477.1 hypothetical protein U8307_10500 [Sedimentibacter sp. MB36-C1]
MILSEYLKNLKQKLQSNFDLTENYVINEMKYDLFAEYHVRSERYVMIKKAVAYAIEVNEFCFIKYYEKLDKNKIENFIDSLIKSINLVVKPNNEHMSSMITGVIVVDEMPKSEITDIIKKFKYHKGFAFGFKGWVDVRVILVSLNEGFVITNKKGKEVSEVYSI